MAINSKAVASLSSTDLTSFKRRPHLQRALYHLRHDYLTLLAMSVVGLLAFISLMAPIFGDQMLGRGYERQNLQRTFERPNADYWLGTDELGRDHLVRLMYGGQVSLGIAFTAAMLSLAIGVSLGLITGFYGGIVDDFFIWFITTLNSIPSLFLLLIVASILKPGPLGLILVLGLLGWTGTMRLVRGETLALREREFIIAARAMGASNWRIMFQHILPNLISIVIITLAIDIGGLILAESALSFLGFGIPPYIPSWGNMLTNSQSYFRNAPHLVFMPGILISITVLCLYVIGDGIRDALDPTVGDE